MSNRYITITLLALVLFLFFTYFIIQRVSLPSGQPITGYFQGIIRDVEESDWEEAQDKALRLEEEWEKQKYLIMLNYSESDYQVFENTVYRLASATKSKERYEALSLARIGEKLWENFLKIIPEP